jgi:uncharacterized membrane protein
VEGRVGFSAEGRVLGSSAAPLRAGENRLTVRASVNTPGTFDLAGVLEAPGLGEVRFAQAVTVRRPRVLFLSQDPDGTESHLMEALQAAEFEFVKTPGFPPAGFGAFQVVILNNWDLERIPEPLKRDLESHVQHGGGLLVIAGERNLYVEDRARREDQLERALPARLLPPRSPEGTCVVLIVDKSSSMEGKKMELARLSAIGVVENLRPVDRVGVLIFDNSFQWAVPIRRAEDKNQIKRLISGIIADGGTQIAPALSEAYRRVLPVQATYKHIVLLTDGISEEGDSVSLAQEAASQRVTISTVGLGQDVNKAFLDKVASLAKGKSHFLTDPAGLAQILLRDVLEHTGQTAVEKPVVPVVEKEVEVIAGLDLASAPPLLGYVRFEAKPTADLILRFEPKDPLLVRWQYGLGRAAVFTSDAKSRWAEAWVRWPGFDPFWVNVVRDLLPHSEAGRAEVRLDGGTGELTASYRLAAGVAEPAAPPEVFVLGGGGFRRPLAIRKLAPGAWEGRVRLGRAAEGLFRIRPLEESSVFPEAGLYLPERELSEFGNREELLRGIADFTGGRFEPPPARLFETDGRGVPATLNLWAGLLGLAAAVNLGELVHRKWRGITSSRRPG